jgi:hypothetical protein
MDVETVSVDMSQSSVQEPPPPPAHREEEQPAPVETISSAQTVTDPNLGQTVNILD